MAQTQNLIPFPELQFLDNDGSPLAGGKVWTFAADGLTPKATYQDPAGTTLNTNPITLDSSGRALVWGTGNYVWGVYDSLGNEIYIQPTADPLALLGVSPAMVPVVQASSTAAALVLLGGAPAGSNLPVGIGPLPWGGAAVPAKWLLCYGQAVSRTTYAALFGVIGTAFGVGNGSTTFNIPDMRGRFPGGVDAMGGTSAGRITAASLGAGNAAVLGYASGTELAQADTLTVVDPGHLHVESPVPSGSGVVSGAVSASAGGTPTTPNTQASTTGITITSGLTGTNQNIPPVLFVNYIIFAGA